MKKVLNYFPFIVLALLISCENPSSTQAPHKIPKRKIDSTLSLLVKAYPNYESNEIVRDNAAKQLKKKIDSLYPKGFLSDIPLKIFRMKKNPYGKGVIVQFYADNYNGDETGRLSDRLEFDIIGFVDEKLASSLKENGRYYISGKKNEKIN